MTSIVPTVGRNLWFYPGSESANVEFAPTSPCAAIIAKVLSPTELNLAVFDGNGTAHSRTGVPLIQEGQTAPAAGYYCTWMPFQTGQAQKTEELERKLAGK